MPREVEMFFRTMRETLPEQPDPRLEGALVAQLAQTARAPQNGRGETATVAQPVIARPQGAWRSPRRLAARIAIAAGLLVLSMAGLAVAGVTLPGPVNSVLGEVGVTLPNQPDEDAGEGDDAPAAPKPGTGGPAGATDKADRHSKPKNADKPGRRVRRQGNDEPVPGPATPPEGNAFGQSKPRPKPEPPAAPAPPAPQSKPSPRPNGAPPAIGKNRVSVPGAVGPEQ